MGTPAVGQDISPNRSLVMDLGKEDYLKVLLVQRHLNYLSNEGFLGDSLILLEHNDVYTLGIHRNPSEILAPDIMPIEVERGGSATYHGPGQIVAYFVVNLRRRNLNIRDLIQRVEEAISDILSEYSIKSEGRLHGETGVWVRDRKICSIGFAIKGFSTLHGIALNVSTDLSKFNSIMPCGMQPTVMTSMEREVNASVDVNEVKRKMRESFLSTLGIKDYLEINEIKKLGNYSVGNGLGLLPEELRKIIV